MEQHQGGRLVPEPLSMVRIGAGDISFSDLLDVLDAAFMVHIEGGNGNWSVMAVADFGGSRETFIDGVTYRF